MCFLWHTQSIIKVWINWLIIKRFYIKHTDFWLTGCNTPTGWLGARPPLDPQSLEEPCLPNPAWAADLTSLAMSHPCLWHVHYTLNGGEALPNGNTNHSNIGLSEIPVFAFLWRNRNQTWSIITEIQMIMTEQKYHMDTVFWFSDAFIYFNLLELENPEAFLFCFYSNSAACPRPQKWTGYISPDQWLQANPNRNLWAQETIFPIALQNDPHRCSIKGKNEIPTSKKPRKDNAI